MKKKERMFVDQKTVMEKLHPLLNTHIPSTISIHIIVRLKLSLTSGGIYINFCHVIATTTI